MNPQIDNKIIDTVKNAALKTGTCVNIKKKAIYKNDLKVVEYIVFNRNTEFSDKTEILHPRKIPKKIKMRIVEFH